MLRPRFRAQRFGVRGLVRTLRKEAACCHGVGVPRAGAHPLPPRGQVRSPAKRRRVAALHSAARESNAGFPGCEGDTGFPARVTLLAVNSFPAAFCFTMLARVFLMSLDTNASYLRTHRNPKASLLEPGPLFCARIAVRLLLAQSPQPPPRRAR